MTNCKVHYCYSVAKICACFLLLAGCTTKDATNTQLSQTPHIIERSAQDLSENDLTKATPDGLAQWINQQSQPFVLVDFWATWCPPCVEKFPRLIEFAKERSDDLQILAISCDDLSETETVLKLLNRFQPSFPQWIVPDGAYEANIAFDLDSLPTYRLYNNRGELLKEWEGEFEIADIEKEIESRTSSYP